MLPILHFQVAHSGLLSNSFPRPTAKKPNRDKSPLSLNQPTQGPLNHKFQKRAWAVRSCGHVKRFRSFSDFSYAHRELNCTASVFRLACVLQSVGLTIGYFHQNWELSSTLKQCPPNSYTRPHFSDQKTTHLSPPGTNARRRHPFNHS